MRDDFQMLATRALPAHLSILLLGLTLGCAPPPNEPPPGTETAANSDPLSMEPADPCAALQGSRFRSVKLHELGPSAHGIPTLGRWQITFGDAEFEWVRGQRSESGSYTCADLNPTGLTSDGRELGGTYDLFTGLLTWDGIVYLNETGAADLDVCAAIDGNNFSALEASEAGLGPEGATFARAGISFEGGNFHWSYSDVVETGAYTCAEGRIIATRSDGSAILVSYEPVMGLLTWDGARYGDHREFPATDP